MNTKLEQVLRQYLNHREIVVWGNPTPLLVRALKGYSYSAKKAVDPKKHYVIAVNSEEEADFFLEEQSEAFTLAEDYITFDDIGGELPMEWECYGAKIGRQTYFGSSFVEACEDGTIKEIGQFTSINATAQIANDHQQNMTFLSDELVDLFHEENKAKYKSKYRMDPKCPYDVNQRLLTIGNDVWIGANVFINCSKVRTIGDGAMIGSGAVVLEDVPPYAVVVGVPGKVKRVRFPPEMIETLLRVKWWDWSVEELNQNADALLDPTLFYERFKGN